MKTSVMVRLRSIVQILEILILVRETERQIQKFVSFKLHAVE